MAMIDRHLSLVKLGTSQGTHRLDHGQQPWGFSYYLTKFKKSLIDAESWPFAKMEDQSA